MKGVLPAIQEVSTGAAAVLKKLSSAFGKELSTKYRPHLLLTGGTLLIAGALYATGPQAIPEAMSEKAWPVTVIEAQPSWLQPAFTAFGRFEARSQSTLSSDLVARVAEVAVSEGDEVVAGEVLLRLDSGDLERRVREAQAALQIARADLAGIRNQMQLADRTRKDYSALLTAAQAKLERHRELLSRRLISQVLFDDVASQAAEASIRNQTQLQLIDDLPNRLAQAQAGVSRNEAMLEQAQADLEESVIHAPCSGPVLAVHASPGEMNVPGQPLIEVSSRASFELRVEVPDRQAARLETYVQQRQPVIALAADGSRHELRRIGRQVRAGQGGVDAFFVPSTTAISGLHIGRTIETMIQLPAEADLIAVPPESLYENNRIYTVVDKRLHAVQVDRVGEIRQDDEYRILVRASGLPASTAILATQLPQAVTGMLVEPIQSADSKGDKVDRGDTDAASSVAGQRDLPEPALSAAGSGDSTGVYMI